MTDKTMTKSEQQIDSDARALVSSWTEVPDLTSKVVSEHLGAIAKATPETLDAALREHGGAIYTDPTALAHGAAVAAAAAKYGREAADALNANAVRIVRNARKVNPKITATAIGSAVEGRDLDATGRKRWSRYANAWDMVQASNKAVSEGKREGSAISAKAALTALQQQFEPVAELKARAAEGRDLPKVKGETQTDAAGTETKVRVTKGSDVVDAVERLSDALRFLSEPLSDAQVKRVETVLAILTKRLQEKTDA